MFNPSLMKKEGGKFTGSIDSFDRSWKYRKEALYNHWTNGFPKNQIQLAFRKHWELFNELIKTEGRKCLEVGCGRGSISSYFSDNGYDCTLLDSSESVLDIARKIFNANGQNASFVCGDTNALPFNEKSFDVVVSIGLLEHFEDVKKPVSEHIRVLRPGGIFLGYIVPGRTDNVQKYFGPLNKVIRGIYMFAKGAKEEVKKEEIYRNGYDSSEYVKSLQNLPVEDIRVMGVYPLPMISHSAEFPFSLMSPPLEYLLTLLFSMVLLIRRLIYRRNPWLCEEKWGQAFLVYCRKAV